MPEFRQNTSETVEINASVAAKAAWVKPALIRVGDEGVEGKSVPTVDEYNAWVGPS